MSVESFVRKAHRVFALLFLLTIAPAGAPGRRTSLVTWRAVDMEPWSGQA